MITDKQIKKYISTMETGCFWNGDEDGGFTESYGYEEIKAVRKFAKWIQSQTPSGVKWVEKDYLPEPFKVVAIKVLLEDNGPRQDWELKWDFVNKEGKWVSHPSFVRLMWLDEASQQTTALQARVEELERENNHLQLNLNLAKNANESKKGRIAELERENETLMEAKDDMFGALLLANSDNKMLMGLLKQMYILRCADHQAVSDWKGYCEIHNLNTEK